MLHRSRFVFAVLAALPLLGACVDVTSGNEGDCNARIRYEGVIYRPHNALVETPPRGEELGTGDVVDCAEGASAPKVDEVTVFAVEGVPRSIAVKTRQGEWEGIYVAEGVPQSAWPGSLRRP